MNAIKMMITWKENHPYSGGYERSNKPAFGLFHHSAPRSNPVAWNPGYASENVNRYA